MKKIPTVVFLFLFIFSPALRAQYTKLMDFAGVSNGSRPQFTALISDGTFLYGMTASGGANLNNGLIFKIKPDGTSYSDLLDFGFNSNGGAPDGSLISDGTFLYGMTSANGTNNMGVIFKIKPDGTSYSKLLDFAGASNGEYPFGSLVSDGTFLYGMTANGGTNNMGVIFKIKTDGTAYSKLIDLAGASNGSNPDGSLIYDGTFLFGMTANGGANNMGVIFKIKTDGTSYSKLLDFSGIAEGQNPLGSLMSDGTFLYGMTKFGGTNNMGAIFKIKTDGTSFVKLFDFSGAADGMNPSGNLITDGTFLYGMAGSGGANNFGVGFKIKTDGTAYSKLIDFAGASNGQWPAGSFFSDGSFLYGMTWKGGANNMGVLFKYQIAPSGISEINDRSPVLTVFPNPFSNEAILKVNTEIKNAELIVYDVLGNEVMKMKDLNTQEILIHRNELNSGIYFFRLFDDLKNNFSGKFIIE